MCCLRHASRVSAVRPRAVCTRKPNEPEIDRQINITPSLLRLSVSLHISINPVALSYGPYLPPPSRQRIRMPSIRQLRVAIARVRLRPAIPPLRSQIQAKPLAPHAIHAPRRPHRERGRRRQVCPVARMLHLVLRGGGSVG
jgi:hypothetical protein